jgi:hypothetical protein
VYVQGVRRLTNGKRAAASSGSVRRTKIAGNHNSGLSAASLGFADRRAGGGRRERHEPEFGELAAAKGAKFSWLQAIEKSKNGEGISFRSLRQKRR